MAPHKAEIVFGRLGDGLNGVCTRLDSFKYLRIDIFYFGGNTPSWIAGWDTKQPEKYCWTYDLFVWNAAASPISTLNYGGRMVEDQVYRCQNRDCGCEVKVIKPSIESNSNPRCFCSAEMKKPYKEPVLRCLNPDVEVFSSIEHNL